MNKAVLIESLQNTGRSEEVCTEVVEATFKLLEEMVSLDQSLSITGVGMIGAHYRKGANKELPNEEGVVAQKNLSIFFHPTAEVKAVVDTLVEDEFTD